MTLYTENGKVRVGDATQNRFEEAEPTTADAAKGNPATESPRTSYETGEVPASPSSQASIIVSAESMRRRFPGVSGICRRNRHASLHSLQTPWLDLTATLQKYVLPGLKSPGSGIRHSGIPADGVNEINLSKVVDTGNLKSGLGLIWI